MLAEKGKTEEKQEIGNKFTLRNYKNKSNISLTAAFIHLLPDQENFWYQLQEYFRAENSLILI